jgi:CII-binding regulator of phage lambda lysogenization HflD
MLLTNPALAGRLAQAAQERAHIEFSAEKMVEHTSDIYADVLATRGVA